MPHNTETLVLEIIRQDSILAMSVFGQDELTSTLRHYSRLPLSSTEINKICLEVISILNKVDKKANSDDNSLHSLKKASQLLWDHLLTKAVKDKLKTAPSSNLILSLDEDLISIPWELLYDGKDFLCLKFNLGRVVRTKGQVSPPQYRSLSSMAKMLILANPTNDLRSTYLEGLFIKNQLDRKRKEMAIDFKSTNIDTLYVKKNLRDYDIVHFAGHCEYDMDEPMKSGWVLSDGNFTAYDIQAMAEDPSLPTLIFSHACYSAKVGSENFDLDAQEKTYSLASAFLFSGVRHYIGSIRRLEDSVSLTFAKEFYTELVAGKSIGECVRLARGALIKEYGMTVIPWASYLLYGDPNFVLFRPKYSQPKIEVKVSHLIKKPLVKTLAGIIIISILSIYLYMWLPTLNPHTYIEFLRARNLFLKGKNQEAISLTRRIIQKEPFFLAAYAQLGDTYQRIGKRQESLKWYFEYALNSEKRQDKKGLADAYTKIGWVYYLQGGIPKAIDFYNKAIVLSQENKDSLREADALGKLALCYRDKEDYEQALSLLTKSSEINRQKQHISGHLYNLACDYFNLGLIFTDKDDFSAAKEFYAKSRRLFERLKLKYELSDYYFNLGEICKFEKHYQQALDYYIRGLAIDQAQGSKVSLVSDYSMLGELYLEMDNLKEAEEYFRKAISACREIEARPELAEAYYDLGLLYQQKNEKGKAEEFFKKAKEVTGADESRN